MSLTDILRAIDVEADEQIAQLRSSHEAKMSQLKRESEEALAAERRSIDAETGERKTAIKRAADMRMRTKCRNALLQKKRDLLERLYDELIDALAQLPDAKVEPLLQACIASLPTDKKGTIRPASRHQALLKKLAPSLELGEPIDAAGGFVFSTAEREHNCTFEYLVHNILRPKTELDLAERLFSDSRAS